MTLTEFLLRRIAEDESRAQAALDVLDGDAWDDPDGEFVGRSGGGVFDHVLRHSPSRVLAECEAKRKIIAWRQEEDTLLDYAYDVIRPVDAPDWATGAEWGFDFALQVLALGYADHPDYREEWKP